MLCVYCKGGFGLSGTFPNGVVKFPYLEEIRMSHGNLHGPLPESIATMKYLLQIDLQYNSLSGTIPDTWYRARSFQRIDIRGNRISGTISSSISQWRDMTSLHMYWKVVFPRKLVIWVIYMNFSSKRIN